MSILLINSIYEISHISLSNVSRFLLFLITNIPTAWKHANQFKFLFSKVKAFINEHADL